MILLFCLLLFVNSARAMHEEDTSEQKAATVSKTAKEPQKIPKTERELNEALAERGDQQAIQRKMSGLLGGVNSYEQGLKAAEEFQEFIKIKPALPQVLESYTPQTQGHLMKKDS